MAQTADFELLLDVEIESLQRALLRYAEATGRSLGVVVRQNTRLIAWNLAHNTQPYGMDKAAQRRGDTSIAIDLFGGKKGPAGSGIGRAGIFFSVEDHILKKFQDHWGSNVKIKAWSGGRKVFATKTGEVWATEETLYRPDASQNELRAHHARYFQNGRMTAAGSRDRVTGRWRFIDRMVVGKKALLEYLKATQKKVGFAKAGWITAGSQVGNVTKVPAWITRHKGQAPGRADDQSQRKSDPWIRITNEVSYISNILPDKSVADALRIQREKMLAHIEHVLTEEARAAGFTAQPTGPATPLPMAA